MGKTGDGRNQGVRDSDAMGAIGTSLLQTLDGLPQAPPKTQRNDHVVLARRSREVRRLSGRSGSHRRQAQQDQVIVQITREVCRQIAAEQNNPPGLVQPLGHRRDLLAVQYVAQSLQALHVIVDGFLDVGGQIRSLRLAALHHV